MINIYSLFDSLYIGKNLQEYIGDFNLSEVQMLSYFSCLLSLYDGNPISFWEYKFIKNEMGVPLCFEINEAVEKLEQNNEFLLKDDNYFNITEEGISKLNTFLSFDLYNHRIKYLKAACESLLAVPIGSFRSSLFEEPLIKLANGGEIRNLIGDENIGLVTLYNQFEILKTALNEQYADLFVPAVTWLRYLNKTQIA